MENNYKLVLLGDSSVGKSSLASYFISKQFYEFQEPTIGAAFISKQITIENKNINVEIWDTAGQERYKSLAPMYYRGAEGAIIVYDITQKDSFKGAKSWLDEIKAKGHEHCEIILVGNKLDLDEYRDIDKNDVMDFTMGNSITQLLTSAKTGENIELVFERLCKKIFEARKIKKSRPNTPIDIETEQIKTCCY